MKKAEYKNILSLSYSLAKVNFKLRNEGSYLGVLWYLLNPLAFFLIILYIRGAIFSSGGVVNYPAYLLIGLIMINFFNQAVGTSIELIRNNAAFIKSMKISYEVFVLSTIFQVIFSHIFELLLVSVLFLYLHISLVGIVWYVFVFVFFALFTLGACFLGATIGLYFTDLKNIWSIFSQLLFFFTPVFYVAVHGSYLYLSNLANPLFYFFSAARDVSIYGVMPTLLQSGVILFISFGFLAVGLWVFEKYKVTFAEFV